jgi:hypothetical protein
MWLMLGIVILSFVVLAIQAARSGVSLGGSVTENGGPFGDAVGAPSPSSPTLGGGALKM